MKYKYEYQDWNSKKTIVKSTDDLQEVFSAKYKWAFNDRNMMSKKAFFRFYEGGVELNNDFFKDKGLYYDYK